MGLSLLAVFAFLKYIFDPIPIDDRPVFARLVNFCRQEPLSSIISFEMSLPQISNLSEPYVLCLKHPISCYMWDEEVFKGL